MLTRGRLDAMFCWLQLPCSREKTQVSFVAALCCASSSVYLQSKQGMPLVSNTAPSECDLTLLALMLNKDASGHETSTLGSSYNFM